MCMNIKWEEKDSLLHLHLQIVPYLLLLLLLQESFLLLLLDSTSSSCSNKLLHAHTASEFYISEMMMKNTQQSTLATAKKSKKNFVYKNVLAVLLTPLKIGFLAITLGLLYSAILYHIIIMWETKLLLVTSLDRIRFVELKHAVESVSEFLDLTQYFWVKLFFELAFFQRRNERECERFYLSLFFTEWEVFEIKWKFCSSLYIKLRLYAIKMC